MTESKYKISFVNEKGLSQSEEYFFVDIEGKQKKISLHDYKTIYQYPWLYEAVLYDYLGCQTPEGICEIINKLFAELHIDKKQLHMLET